MAPFVVKNPRQFTLAKLLKRLGRCRFAFTQSARSVKIKRLWRSANGIGCLVGITLVAASLDIISVLFDLFD